MYLNTKNKVIAQKDSLKPDIDTDIRNENITHM